MTIDCLQAEKEGKAGDVKVPLSSEQFHAVLQFGIQMAMIHAMLFPTDGILSHLTNRIDPQQDKDQQESREVQVRLSTDAGQETRLEELLPSVSRRINERKADVMLRTGKQEGWQVTYVRAGISGRRSRMMNPIST